MQAVTRVQTVNGNSVVTPINYLITPIAVTFVIGITGTATGKVQYTADDISTASDNTGTGLTWVDTATGAVSATTGGSIAFPVTGLRTVASGISGGTVTTRILQAGRP